MYSAQKIRVTKEHSLYPYFEKLCKNAKLLSNATQFYLRQIYSGLTSEKSLHVIQKEVFKKLEETLPLMNEIREKSFKRKVAKGKKAELSLFTMPTEKKAFVSYDFLEAFFKCTNNPDYRSLPAQVNQQVMKQVFQDWKSFFSSIRDYKKNPSKYQGKPSIPRYKKKDRITCMLTNQVCEVKDTFLVFPNTDEKLNIGKLATLGTLQQVRVIPVSDDEIVVELILLQKAPDNAIVRKEDEDQNKVVHEAIKIMSIDLGVDVLAAIVDNQGNQPILMKGKILKSVNQWYNKQMAHYTSALRNGKDPKEGSFTSKRLQQMTLKRNRQIDDLLHKASAQIVRIAVERELDTIVIGKNKLWKHEIEMRKKDKQNFVGIPYNKFCNMIKYKAERLGIQVIEQEESYTSQACFLSGDFIPIYGEKGADKVKFSGTRSKRAWYRVKKTKITWHADLNASANILRKRFPKAFEGVDTSYLLQKPLSLHVIPKRIAG